MIVSSPAHDPKPISFSKEQEIAFIYNRTDVVPGIITSINPDSTYDLLCSIPITVRKINWNKNGNFNITSGTDLVATEFLRAIPVDPRMQVVKTITSLSELGMEPIDDPARGHKQSSISSWRDSGRRVRVPKLTEFFAPLVGHFFDSSLFYYKIRCWRAAINLRSQGIIPEEIQFFPKRKPYYTTFSKCFSRYYKEYISNLEKWNRVEMLALLPEDLKEKQNADSTSINGSSNSSPTSIPGGSD